MTGSRVYGSERTTYTTALWQNTLDAVQSDDVPELPLLRHLRKAIVKEVKNDNPEYLQRRVALSVYLHEDLYDLDKAWEELQELMADLHIDETDLLRRAREEKAKFIYNKKQDLSPPHEDGFAFEDEAYGAAPSSDITHALARSAARFEEAAPKTPRSVEAENELEWLQLDELPEETRELIRLARERVEDLIDVELPQHLQKFLADGEVEYSSENPPYEFWRDIRLLFTAEMGADGELVIMDEPDELMELIHHAIEKIEDWVPINELPKPMRELIMAAREMAILLYGGNLSWYKTNKGWEYSARRNKHISSILENALIQYSKQVPPHKVWHDFRQILFRTDVDENGEYIQAVEQPELIDLILPAVESMEGWSPLNQVPEYMQKLVKTLRIKAIELYGGRVFKDDTHPLQALLAKGLINYCGSYPARTFWHLLRQVFFKTGMGANGKLIDVDEPAGVMDLIYPVIEKREEWLSIDQVPKVVREVVREGRTKFINVFGGRFPYEGFETIDGWKSGSLAYSPVNALINDGTIMYSQSNLPSVLFDKCTNQLFRVELTPEGRYQHVDVPKPITDMLAKLKDEGTKAWETYGNGRSVPHPGTVKPTSPASTGSAIAFVSATLASNDGFTVHIEPNPYPFNPLMFGAFRTISITQGCMMGFGITGYPIH
ncbi:MAG: hypothetical protein ABH871_08065 [Pseudomonadota bacterium]